MCTWCNAYNQQHSQPQPQHPAALFAACTVLVLALAAGASYVGELDMRGSLIPALAYPSSPHLKPIMPHINISSQVTQVTASVRHLPPQNSTSLDPTRATASQQHNFVHHPLRPSPHCRLQLPVPVPQTAQLRCVPTPPSPRSASGGCCRPCASPLAAATTLTVGAAQPLRRRLRPAHLETPHPLPHTNPVLRARRPPAAARFPAATD